MEAESLSISLEPAVESPRMKRPRSAVTPDEEPPSKRRKSWEPSPPRKYPKPLPRNGGDHDVFGVLGPELLLTIDNASILELWASVVTQRLHPNLSWETCLSAGNAISRFVRDGVTYNINRHRDEVEKGDSLYQVCGLDTMRFKLVLNANLVVFGEETLPGDENILKSKFGTPHDYALIKLCLEGMTTQFSNDYLDERALNIFDFFRPTVKQGLDPWSTRNLFNVMHVSLCGHEYGAEDIRWFRQKAEEEEEEFIEQERLLALERAAAKKKIPRTKPEPTPPTYNKSRGSESKGQIPRDINCESVHVITKITGTTFTTEESEDSET